MTTSDSDATIRVVVIHDDGAVQNAVRRTLAAHSCTMEFVAPADATEVMSDVPDVVLCPRSVVEAIGLPRDATDGARYPFVILLAAQGDEEDDEPLADDVLRVPVDPAAVVRRMRTARRVVARERRLWEQARRDPVTDLPNRRACDEELEREWERAVRYGRPLACALVDVDRFKSVNDERGHVVGDAVLVQIAEVVRASTRSSDFVGRYGGDEFLVLLPETDLSDAGVCCDRLVEAVSNAMAGPETPLPTITVGVAERGSTMARAAELLKAADANLRAGKSAGGNRSVHTA